MTQRTQHLSLSAGNLVQKKLQTDCDFVRVFFEKNFYSACLLHVIEDAVPIPTNTALIRLQKSRPGIILFCLSPRVRPTIDRRTTAQCFTTEIILAEI
jgi:hypothetical protein